VLSYEVILSGIAVLHNEDPTAAIITSPLPSTSSPDASSPSQGLCIFCSLDVFPRIDLVERNHFCVAGSSSQAHHPGHANTTTTNNAASPTLKLTGVNIKCFNLMSMHPVNSQGVGISLKEYSHLQKHPPREKQRMSPTERWQAHLSVAHFFCFLFFSTRERGYPGSFSTFAVHRGVFYEWHEAETGRRGKVRVDSH
jgi:hypothetical protein